MAFADFLADINAKGVPSIVECVRLDNGTEFTNPEFVALLKERGIRREYTLVGSPKYDGVVERQIARACYGAPPGHSPSASRREDAADAASLG